ncbi:MAG: hypothetical protein AAF664_05315 [Planctomycetota bacterium]
MSTQVNVQAQEESRVSSVMRSYNGLPTWVKVWMNFILGPINLATLAFLDQPGGGSIAALSLSGMAFTVAIVFAVGGFQKIAAAGHILPWTPLLLILAFARPEGTAIYQAFLTALLVVNVISLAFDFNDLRAFAKPKRNATA